MKFFTFFSQAEILLAFVSLVTPYPENRHLKGPGYVGKLEMFSVNC
jgi:hypothetical protein